MFQGLEEVERPVLTRLLERPIVRYNEFMLVFEVLHEGRRQVDIYSNGSSSRLSIL